MLILSFCLLFSFTFVLIKIESTNVRTFSRCRNSLLCSAKEKKLEQYDIPLYSDGEIIYSPTDKIGHQLPPDHLWYPYYRLQKPKELKFELHSLRALHETNEESLSNLVKQTNQYLNDNEPALYSYPQPMRINGECSRFLTTLISLKRNLVKYRNSSYIEDIWPDNNKSPRYLFGTRNELFSLKLFNRASLFSIEANIYYAITVHATEKVPRTTLLYLEKENSHIKYHLTPIQQNVFLLEDGGTHCLSLSHQPGDTLRDMDKNNLFYSDNYLRESVRLIILILKQLQLVHFSLNHFPLEYNRNILQQNQFALGHGQLSTDNIIMVKLRQDKYYPLLINYGFNVRSILPRQQDVFVHFYNNALNKDITRPLIMHKKRRFLPYQNYDFCGVLIIILQLETYEAQTHKIFGKKQSDLEFGKAMRYCLGFKTEIEKLEYVHEHLPFVTQRRSFLMKLGALSRLLIQGILDYASYSTWFQIQKLMTTY
ncbi:hypothetical protein SNEBB_001651 [Seison nebaliae]|nr:hypothetical protein SNEBB_001651 [Seison nebaliae]